MRRATCADDPPVGPGFAGQRQERALARDAALRVGDGAVLLAPGGGRQQHMRARRDRVGRGDVLGDDEQFEPSQRVAHGAGARQRHGRIGRHHPQRLDLAARDRLEHVDGLEAFRWAMRGAFQNRRTRSMSSGAKPHVGGELIGKPADLAPAHGVGLAGERERPHAGLADAAGGEVAVDDGVDLVGALRRLVHALREAGDDARGVARNKSKNRATSASLRPVAAAVAAMSGAISRARASAPSKPAVCASI